MTSYLHVHNISGEVGDLARRSLAFIRLIDTFRRSLASRTGTPKHAPRKPNPYIGHFGASKKPIVNDWL